MLARDSEARHAVGAENELPDISEYSRGQAGLLRHLLRCGRRSLIQRGRTFYIGKLGDQQREDHRPPRPGRPPGPEGRRRGHRPRSCRSPGAGRERSPGAPRACPRAERGPPAPRRAGSAPGGPRRAPGGHGGPVPAARLRPHLGRGGRPPAGRVEDHRARVPRRDARVRLRRGGRRRPVLGVAALRAARGTRKTCAELGRSVHHPGGPRPGGARRPGAMRTTRPASVLEEVRRIAGRKRLSVVPGAPGDGE